MVVVSVGLEFWMESMVSLEEVVFVMADSSSTVRARPEWVGLDRKHGVANGWMWAKFLLVAIF